ncbi:hypothetical protein D3C85_1547290 [compost metagenome]
MIIQELGGSLACQLREQLAHLLSNCTFVDTRGHELDEILIGAGQQACQEFFDLADIFQLASRADDRLDIKRTFGQLQQFRHHMLIYV